MFASNCLSLLAILLITMTCLADPVRAESDSPDWGIMAARSKEYASGDVPKEIPGKGTENSTLTVTDTGAIVDLNVKLNIAHPYDADLDIYLIAPDGTRVELFTDVGGTSANFEDTILDDEASESITDGSAPFNGSYRPEGSLADFKTRDIAGTWTLEVTDDWGVSRAGTLNSWSLIVTLEVKEPLPPPVIHAESSVPGGMRDTIRWDDTGQVRQYDSTVAQAIPDQGTVTPTLVIDDFGMIEDLNVKLNITHGLDSDLDVFLVAPDGKTRVELFTDVGGLGDNFTDTILDDETSLSITGGSAPFTGTYRPEGRLSDLIGKDIHGTWTLEVTDDSLLSSGTLNSWSLVVDVADALYCAECATDAEFSSVVADSGWMVDRSYTFTGLDPSSRYWYRVKARPMETWLQTSQSDFQTDTLTSTETTSDGDVTLASGGGGLGPPVNVIQNPSFELYGGWLGASNNPILAATCLGIWRGLWASDGLWAGGVIVFSDFTFPKGTYAYLLQRDIDWTGVGTLVFDYCSFYGSEMTSQVLIGDQEVWSHTHANRWAADHSDIAVDVSGITGRKDLKLRVEVIGISGTNSAVLWDKLRTYGPGGYGTPGTIVSTPIRLGDGDTWDILAFNATTPVGTALTVDVLPVSGSLPIDPWRQIPSGSGGADLSGLAEGNIRLRANLSTSNIAVTPVLHEWSVSYTDAARQSAWSNVESSVPPQ